MDFSVSGLTYDPNGNITAMTQRGVDVSSADAIGKNLVGLPEYILDRSKVNITGGVRIKSTFLNYEIIYII